MAKTLKDLVGAARAKIKEVSAAELAPAVEDETLLLVDVREPGEYAAGHIPGAVSIPRGIIEPAADLAYPKRHPELSAARDRRVVLYCATGGRSALAAVALGEMGFGSVESLAGGFDGWQSGGGKVSGA